MDVLCPVCHPDALLNRDMVRNHTDNRDIIHYNCLKCGKYGVTIEVYSPSYTIPSPSYYNSLRKSER